MHFQDLLLSPNPSKYIAGVSGEYFVCGELGKIGILALLTPKNNPLFDIVATDRAGDKYIFISIKTMGIENKDGWFLSKEYLKKRGNPNFYVVLVNLKIGQPNDYYVYLFDDLVDRITSKLAKMKDKGSKQKNKIITLRLIDFKPDDHRKKNDWKLIQHHLQ